MTDFSNTMIRCSALGQIMTNPTGKTPMEKYTSALESLSGKEKQYEKLIKKEGVMGTRWKAEIAALKGTIPALEAEKDDEFLSKSCQSHLIKTYALEKYNRIKDVETKEMVKGIVVEDDSIELFSTMEGRKYEKNKIRLSNGVISGLPDLFDGEDISSAERVIDIKSSYDIETFLKNVTNPLSSQYYWQLQGYLWLTSAPIGVVTYCLVNTPESIINQQAEFLIRKLDVVTSEDPLYQREYQKMVRNMVFDDIAIEERIIRVEVERNDDDIEKIYKKVLKCREFLQEFQEKHLFFTKNYRRGIVNIEELEETK